MTSWGGDDGVERGFFSSFGFGGEARPKIDAFSEISMTKDDGIRPRSVDFG